VAKPRAAGPRRQEDEPKLTRVAFKVSRLMEFCSERELQNQTGHALYEWPLVVGKELMDNALDACEEAEVAPYITVTVDPGTIIVQDNAGGIDTETIKSILDYAVRVSSREAYAAPTRGAAQCQLAGICREQFQTTHGGIHLVQPASHIARIMVRERIHQRRGNQS
jgi:hypothetical protein